MNILVTAGPTREFLDPVRFISNRSSGRMGYALATAGLERNHRVELVTGPVALTPPAGAIVTQVTTAAEMLQAVQDKLDACDALMMCAAVADWRPKQCAVQKLKKHLMNGMLELERTVDILQAVKPLKRSNQVFVGFAAETEAVTQSAVSKLNEKSLDLVVANDVSRTDAGFEVDTNIVTLVSASGVETLPLMTKHAVATRILAWVESRF